MKVTAERDVAVGKKVNVSLWKGNSGARPHWMFGLSDEKNPVLLLLQCGLIFNLRNKSQNILNSMNNYFISFRTKVLFSYTWHY